ncbi:MAG TPA: hypothetical protein VGR54_02035 [Nitrosopumilaceae archaeon]|nr:hypothetical protein [Nitrosopumilaceae archaeon]
MNKVLQLKVAALILFWSGVIVESIMLLGSIHEYLLHHTLFQYPESWFSNSYIVMMLIYYLFVHVSHIVAGYLLAKGKKIGAVAGIAVVVYETVFFIAITPQEVFSAGGIGVRILFVIVGVLIISGRKELGSLQSENWRPWKKPVAPTGSGMT